MQILPQARQALPLRLFLSITFVSAWLGCMGCGERNTDAVRSVPRTETSANSATSENSGEGRFVDIAPTAGIPYRWEIPGKRPLTLLQTIGNGCALFDANNDGNLDILLVGPKLALYRGDGQGHFTEITQETNLHTLSGQFLGCATGDYDNDGFSDLYLSGYRTGLLLHNEQGRRFRNVTAQAGMKPQPWGTSCAFGDVDGDGRLDLYVGNYVRFGPGLGPQLCTRDKHLTACGPLSYKPEFGVFYHNRGDGRFADVTRQWGANQVSGKALGVAFAPRESGTKAGLGGTFAPYASGSGLALAIANDEMPGDLLIRNGGRFANVGLTSGIAYGAEGKPYGGMGIDWGDYNNDGRLDLAIATFQEETKPIFHSEGNGYFEDQSQLLGVAQKTLPYVAFGLKWLDFNNDGRLDLIISNGHIADNIADYDRAHTYRQPTLLFANRGDERFEEVSARTGPELSRPIVGRGLATGDIDNDGKVDVLLVDSEGGPMLLHNQTSPAGHWLRVRLIGTRCNRDGFGALVTAETDSLKLIRHCHTDGSYLSASDPRVHFGLGTADKATITVRWPNGHTDRFLDVRADQQITIRQGTRQLQNTP